MAVSLLEWQRLNFLTGEFASFLHTLKGSLTGVSDPFYQSFCITILLANYLEDLLPLLLKPPNSRQ